MTYPLKTKAFKHLTNLSMASATYPFKTKAFKYPTNLSTASSSKCIISSLSKGKQWCANDYQNATINNYPPSMLIN